MQQRDQLRLILPWPHTRWSVFLVHSSSLVVRSICLRTDRYLSLHFRLPCAVNSIILLTNGISFAVQAILLLTIGAWADYGTWRYA